MISQYSTHGGFTAASLCKVLGSADRSGAGRNQDPVEAEQVLLANALVMESRGCHRRSGPVFVRMKIPITGGCACRAIRYEIKTEPALMLKCHCRDCQHVTGSGYAPAFLVPADTLRVTQGQLRYHQTPSIRREKHKRGFCPECGSRITGGEFEKGDSPFVGVLASSLDDPSLFKPQMDIFVSDAQPWDQMDPAIPKFEQYPPTPTKN